MTESIKITHCGHAPTVRITFPDGKRTYEIHAGTLSEDPHMVRRLLEEWKDAWVEEKAEELHYSYQEQSEIDGEE